jgi:hypothetical protein
MSYKEFAKALAETVANTGPAQDPIPTTTADEPILSPKNPSHSFPSDLWAPGQEPFIYFNIRPTSDPTLKPVGNVSLYMPPTIKVNYGSGWGEFSSDPDKLATAIGVDPNNLTKSLSEGNLGGIYDATVGSMQQNFSLSKLGRYVLSNVAEKKFGATYAQKARKAANGNVDNIQNPFTTMIYEGPKLRQFQLDFSLYARNAGESESIRKIIKAFKLAMHPGAEQGNISTFYDYPCCFDIFFLTPSVTKMFNIRRAVLTDMAVDYAGAQVPSFFSESFAPVDIQMSLVFKEMELLTRSEIDENY